MTTVNRIEGTNVDGELTEGLAARTADPLWYLARQWQVGEFQGEDAATPIVIEAEIDCYPVTSTFTETGKTREEIGFDAFERPLQAQVENESSAESLSHRDLLQSSLRLVDLILAAGMDTEYLAAFRKRYQFTPAQLRDEADPVGAARLQILAKSGFDPRRLVKAIASSGAVEKLESLDGLSADEAARVAAAIDQWIGEEEGFAHLRGDGERPAWIDQRQEYRFGVLAELNSEERIELKAPGYTGGKLDWHHFDLHDAPKEYPESKRATLRMLASPLRFAGQPAQRFWEIEEGSIYFGDLAGGAADLSRSMLAAYAAVAGDDWFVLPASLPAGHIARVARVTVRDNFGGPVDVPSIAVADAGNDSDRVWRWFEHRDRTGTVRTRTPLLFMPPVVVDPARGPKLEEVHFRRDEMANLAWAIERRYASAAGRPVVAERPQRTEPPEPGNQGDWTFELGHAIPAQWFPLVPIRTRATSPEVLLRRGLVSHSTSGTPPNRAKGELLTPSKPFLLEESEVPTYGTEVTRRWQMARSADGGRHLWMSRRKRPSNGATGHSPLLYDELSGWPRSRKRR